MKMLELYSLQNQQLRSHPQAAAQPWCRRLLKYSYHAGNLHILGLVASVQIGEKAVFMRVLPSAICDEPLSLQIFFRQRMRGIFRLPINAQDPPAAAVVEELKAIDATRKRARIVFGVA